MDVYTLWRKNVHFAWLLTKIDKTELLTGELAISFDTISPKAKQDINFSIEEWLTTIKPNRILTAWKVLREYLFYFLAPYFLLPTLIWVTANDYSAVLKTKAHTLISSGINEDNLNQAIDLLLKLNSNYSPPNITPNYLSLILLLTMQTVLALIIFFVPKTTFELGLSKTKYTNRKIWAKFITYTFPVFFILPFIINWIIKII